MTAPAIEARDVFRIYATAEGDAAALQGLSLSVAEREVLAVLGPSGAGKTTLLRILAGLEHPSAGRVSVFGRDLADLGTGGLHAYRARTLGYADQHYDRALFPELTAGELVALPLALRAWPRRERLARADELLERVGLRERASARPHELSGGEQQRVAICAALAHRPRLLLADEPTGELDAASAAAVFALIGELARDEGCTTVIVSHDPVSAEIADRTVRIRDGRVSEESSAQARDGAIVVGRGGWLRLPEELLERAGITTRATARLEGTSILVAPAGGEPQPALRRAVPDAPPPRAAERDGEPVVELRRLTRTYGRGAAAASPIDALSATLSAGRLHAVTGPSGSGKTTLLRLVAGLDLPTSGDVVVRGTSLPALDRAGRARFRRDTIAVVDQQPVLVPFLSAVENVELGLALRGRGGRAARRESLEALGAVGLADRSGWATGRLSTGERARVAIARAVAARPAVLCADEPTARLDEANALAVSSLLARLARELGIAVLCATHDPLVIEQADDQLVLG